MDPMEQIIVEEFVSKEEYNKALTEYQAANVRHIGILRALHEADARYGEALTDLDTALLNEEMDWIDSIAARTHHNASRRMYISELEEYRVSAFRLSKARFRLESMSFILQRRMYEKFGVFNEDDVPQEENSIEDKQSYDAEYAEMLMNQSIAESERQYANNSEEE